MMTYRLKTKPLKTKEVLTSRQKLKNVILIEDMEALQHQNTEDGPKVLMLLSERNSQI
jgi:hypothetical protein